MTNIFHKILKKLQEYFSKIVKNKFSKHCLSLILFIYISVSAALNFIIQILKTLENQSKWKYI